MSNLHSLPNHSCALAPMVALSLHRLPSAMLCLTTLQLLSALQPVAPPPRDRAASAVHPLGEPALSKLAVATAPAVSSQVAPAAIEWPSRGPPVPGAPRGPSEFELNLGRVVDVLRTDYPNFFTYATPPPPHTHHSPFFSRFFFPGGFSGWPSGESLPPPSQPHQARARHVHLH